MEITFCELKQKDVVSVNDGKNFGKVCNVTLTFPENKVKGITAVGSKGFHLFKQEVYFPVCQIVRMGDDVVLVKSPPSDPPQKQPKGEGCHGNAPDEGMPDDCFPNHCQPNPCQPPNSNQPNNGCQPNNDPYHGRRDFGEYE